MTEADGGGSDPIQAVDDRDRAANDRDRTSDAQDDVSNARDERAEARDERADTRDRATHHPDRAAVTDRADARRDRQRSAGDRSHAQNDRQASSSDRSMSASDRRASLVDGLTGAYRRDAGIMELEREVTQAKRSTYSFALAFVDVDRLKVVNDAHGHAAGDQLLLDVVAAMRRHLRSYDLIVRYGGDEFLCGLAELTMTKAAERFALINTQLAAEHDASVTVGLAELTMADSLAQLIDRADMDLYQQRKPPAAGHS